MEAMLSSGPRRLPGRAGEPSGILGPVAERGSFSAGSRLAPNLLQQPRHVLPQGLHGLNGSSSFSTSPISWPMPMFQYRAASSAAN